MNTPTEATLLRIFLGEGDRHGHRPLYEVLVEEAHKHGLAGATVLRGIMGYGKKNVIHTAKILRMSEDLPLVVEIVDTAERIDAFLPKVEAMLRGGLITLERARVEVYGDPA